MAGIWSIWPIKTPDILPGMKGLLPFTAAEHSCRNRLLRGPQKATGKDNNDDAFLAQLMRVMEKQMDDNALTVKKVVEEVGMGRTVFFTKLKRLTGLSPVRFIRELRVKRAAQLLESGRYNVTEVTYMVGMNDSRYFAKCFKATFGMTPTDYKKTHTATTLS